MPARKYRSDKKQLLAEGKMIIDPTEDTKYQPKVEIADLMLGEMTPSELCKYARVRTRSLYG